jgi:hypothetical protein
MGLLKAFARKVQSAKFNASKLHLSRCRIQAGSRRQLSLTLWLQPGGKGRAKPLEPFQRFIASVAKAVETANAPSQP